MKSRRPGLQQSPVAILLGAALTFAAIVESSAQVELELVVPPAKTYVIGDSIPLKWRFANRSSESLGFMWEGCCRLNGKLTVTREAQPLAAFPPGQALAHMFAKADRLEPGVPKEYDTLVSDWVSLPGTGTYQLRGTYRGVLPTQKPQVARGLALWRDAAESPPTELHVLSLADYLAEREQRERQRMLRLALKGPTQVMPLVPLPFEVTIRNDGPEPHSLAWPADAALWIVNSSQQRVAPTAVIDAPVTNLIVPPRAEIRRTFSVPFDRFEGEPFGAYTVFVDIAETPGHPRVPAPTLALDWQLEPEQVRNLVDAAAQGAGSGARNAALKFLRVYLETLGPILGSLDFSELHPKARDLGVRLERAARLKQIAPRPGRADITVLIGPGRAPVWKQPAVGAVAAEIARDPRTQLAGLLSLRRHLGWEARLVLEPEDDLTIGELRRTAEQFNDAEISTELVDGNPVILIGAGSTNLPTRLTFGVEGSGRNEGTSLVLSSKGVAWSSSGQGIEKGLTNGVLPDAVRQTLRSQDSIHVYTDEKLRWRDLRRHLEEVVQPGQTLLLLPRESP